MSRRSASSRDSSRRGAVLLVGSAAVVIALCVAVFVRFNGDVDRDVAGSRASDAALQQQRQDERDAKQEAAEAEWKAGLVDLDWPKGRAMRVELYGDSVSYGMDATAEKNTYREVLRRALAKHGRLDWIYRAWPGAKTSDMVNSIRPLDAVDLSIVELGLNDAFKGTPINQFRKSYAEHLDRILAASPESQILCEGLWQSRLDSQYGPYEDVIEEECEAAGGKYLELSPDFRSTRTHGPAGLPVAFFDKVSDSTHPNDYGMQVIAYRLLERLPGLVPDPKAPDDVESRDPAMQPEPVF